MKPLTQLDLWRKMSPVKRLETAIRLSAMTREIAMANIKSQNPDASKAQLNKLLLQRYAGGWY